MDTDMHRMMTDTRTADLLEDDAPAEFVTRWNPDTMPDTADLAEEAYALPDDRPDWSPVG